MKPNLKVVLTAIRAVLFFTVLTGVVYPLSLTFFAKQVYRQKAEGSMRLLDGVVIGSELIGQNFSDPRYFWGRPSAIKYDSASSGGSNQSLTSVDWAKSVREREQQGLFAEMRMASASGLDPDISPRGAVAQVGRIIEARGLKGAQAQELRQLVTKHIEGRQLGFLGEPRVNVLRLNIELREQFGK